MCFLVSLLAGCEQDVVKESQATLYFGGDILTMAGDEPEYVEALIERDGKIVFTGTYDQAITIAGETVSAVDLKGKTLLPGFIDAHGHIYLAGIQRLTTNLLPPPDGNGDGIDALVTLLKNFQKDNPQAVKNSGWIAGFGYDDSQLKERRHPTADDLDRVSTEYPVLIIHQSGHLASMNHKALEMVGYDANTKDPVGGIIRREADGKTPNGVLEEMGFFQAVFPLMAALGEENQERIALAGAEAYAEFGFTTAQDGRATKDAVVMYRKLAAENKLKIDVASYPDLQSETEYIKSIGTESDYTNHFRVAGVKLSFDGSPQGKTAWLTEPYKVPPAGQAEDYRGYPAIPEASIRQQLVDMAFESNWQLLVHCNGDAASEAMIDAMGKAAEKFGNEDRRSVMIHAQTVREDQLDRMQTLGIVPSFFSMHPFYWGDWHRDETLGPERASRISPTGSALQRGMIFTTHHDAPVALPSAIMVLHITVNRLTRSGQVLGPEQRVAPYVALQSQTSWAAWQYFEEDSKGTLEVGKLADLVILDKNPLKVDPANIMNISVVETIKEGNTVYAM
ncbi:amidohydrolase [Ketobacter sp.]|uniref:amidohydrolase n=1 Tax=Ketobacter sp. TaxID=2083498 RepID=UPI0025BE6DA1|nr:amidohydrolase [Ketobacter sp.]